MEQVQTMELKANIPEKKDPKKPGILYTDIGSKMMPVFERVKDPITGRMVVQHTKDFDIDEFIQASNCQTDLAMLRQEMITSGQLPTIDQDAVVDCTLMPQNIHEVYDVVNKMDETYNALPDSIKSIFKTRDEFQKSLVDGSYIDKVTSGLKADYERQVNEAQKAAQEATKEGE